MSEAIDDRELGTLMLGMFAAFLKSKASPLFMRDEPHTLESPDENTTTVKVKTFSGLRYRITVEFLPQESER